ncbi:MAG: hypothetical protein PVI01_11995 [Gemmatimonadales bacterium]|jgi:hypothetical protein
MVDRVFQAFLEREQAAGLALAEASDILSLAPIGASPANRYLAEFRCTGLIHEGGEIRTCDRFVIGFAFPEDYCRRPDAGALVHLLAPQNVWHPNIRFPVICPGMMPAGTGLVDLIFQCYEILTYGEMGLKDPLNEAACRWARRNMDRFPLDRRPLKRPPKTAEQHDFERGPSQPARRANSDGSPQAMEDE